MAKTVLVTGAGGFIGSHLTHLLVQEGYKVKAFVHYNSNNNWYNLEKNSKHTRDAIEVIPGDISDPFSVDNAIKGCDMVFHLAALIGIPYSYVAPGSYVSTNIQGTLNVLMASRKYEIEKIIHTSTSETYGTAQYVPIDELHPLVGQSPYSATKIAADKLAESFWLSFKTPVVTVRPFNTYGPRQSMRAVIPTIIVQALLDNTIKLGDLTPVRDLTYVEDTARGFLAAARSTQALGEVINLGVGKGISIGGLVDLIAEILQKELIVNSETRRVRPVESEVRELISNNSKAKELINWSPTFSLLEGLKKTVEYIAEHQTEYKSNIYAV